MVFQDADKHLEIPSSFKHRPIIETINKLHSYTYTLRTNDSLRLGCVDN